MLGRKSTGAFIARACIPWSCKYLKWRIYDKKDEEERQCAAQRLHRQWCIYPDGTKGWNQG